MVLSSTKSFHQNNESEKNKAWGKEVKTEQPGTALAFAFYFQTTEPQLLPKGEGIPHDLDFTWV